MRDVREQNATLEDTGDWVRVVVEQVTCQFKESSFEGYSGLNRAKEVTNV